MTPIEAHLARAEAVLADTQPATTLDAAALAIAHAVIAYTRHETGYPGDPA